jgi:uncharacterized membrane protein YkvA (DUF1232 family)
MESCGAGEEAVQSGCIEVLQMERHETSRSTGGPNWVAEWVKRLRLAWRLWREPSLPGWLKLIPLGAVVYILLPVDLIPDWILGLGQVDDLGLILLSLRLFLDLCPSEIVQRHLAQMSSIDGSYRVVTEEQPQTTDVAGYLDVDSSPPAKETAPSSAEGSNRSSDEAS